MAESVQRDTVVSIHYTLRDDNKAVVDSSDGGEPLVYLHGHQNIVAGLERALEGKVIGDRINVSVPPGEGYGEHDPALVQQVNRSAFPKGADLSVGTMFHAAGPDGDALVVRVTGVTGDQVQIDGNHPLAGQNLHFDVEITAIRAATESELEHGHAHDGDGHHHQH